MPDEEKNTELGQPRNRLLKQLKSRKLGLPDGQPRGGINLLYLPYRENKTDVGQLSGMKLCLPEGENKTELGDLKKQLIVF